MTPEERNTNTGEKHMTNYNDGKWHGWNGGECPVHPESCVEWVGVQYNMYFTELTQYSRAKDAPFERGGKIVLIAFRVGEEHREPREWWAVAQQILPTKQGAEALLAALNKKHPDLDFGQVIHVREVIE